MSDYQMDRPRLATAKTKVARLMQDQRWHSAAAIRRVGGSEGLRRMRELRKDGWKIIKRRPAEDSGSWEYRATWITRSPLLGR